MAARWLCLCAGGAARRPVCRFLFPFAGGRAPAAARGLPSRFGAAFDFAACLLGGCFFLDVLDCANAIPLNLCNTQNSTRACPASLPDFPRKTTGNLSVAAATRRCAYVRAEAPPVHSGRPQPEAFIFRTFLPSSCAGACRSCCTGSPPRRTDRPASQSAPPQPRPPHRAPCPHP